MKISARNILKGTVAKVTRDAVNAEIVITLPCGDQIVATITNSSAESLGLVEGKEAYAVIKASNVIVAVDV